MLKNLVLASWQFVITFSSYSEYDDDFFWKRDKN